MNKARWKALPDDLKSVFDKACDEAWLREVGRVWRENDDDGIRIAVAAGNEHIVLDHAATEEFRAALAPVVDKWIAAAAGKGLDGRGLVDAARAAIAKHAA